MVIMMRRSRSGMMSLLRSLGIGLVVVVTTGLLFGGEPITIYLAGDSTMAEKRADRRPETGWGEALPAFFDPDQVIIENHARNGRSTRTFIEEGLWEALIAKVRPGDYVLIQFGHNDQPKEKVDRYTPPGAYAANLRRFVAEVRARGATAVLLTPVVRRRFDEDGRFYDVHGEYPDLVRTVADEVNAPLIDMHRLSENVLVTFGRDRSKELFLWLEPGERPNYPEGLSDDTHFSPAGAEIMARTFVEALRASELGIAAHLRDTEAVD